MPVCTQQSHAELKRDAARWATEADPIGEMQVGDGCILVFANCRRCRSTLAVRYLVAGDGPRVLAIDWA